MKNQRRSFLLEPPEQVLSAALAFLRHTRFRLREDYLVKIAAALSELTDEQVWWRPNDASNSAGNLILHLSGNVHQWIIAGVGGQPNLRDRASEFAERRHWMKLTLHWQSWKTMLSPRNPTRRCNANACRKDLPRPCSMLFFTSSDISAITPARSFLSPNGRPRTRFGCTTINS